MAGGEPSEVIVFQENKVEVRKRLKDGRIDYLDLTSWSFQDRLMSFLIEEDFFWVVWEQLSHAAGEGKYSGLVSFGMCGADETAADGGVWAVKIYSSFGPHPDPGEV